MELFVPTEASAGCCALPWSNAFTHGEIFDDRPTPSSAASAASAATAVPIGSVNVLPLEGSPLLAGFLAVAESDGHGSGGCRVLSDCTSSPAVSSSKCSLLCVFGASGVRLVLFEPRTSSLGLGGRRVISSTGGSHHTRCPGEGCFPRLVAAGRL